MNDFLNKKVEFVDIGLKEYEEALSIQQQYFSKNVDIKISNRKLNLTESTTNTLIFCEHPHVYTLGKSGDKNNLLISESFLKEKNATYYPTGRGGDITYHGPGQIVGYPILDLENFFTDIHKYMRFLEDVVIMTLEVFNIVAGRVEGLTGVWVDPESTNPRKICAMGVKASRWITMHGFALNVNTNLDYFTYIVPCGIMDKGVTSIQKELNKQVDVEYVKSLISKYFLKVFEAQL